MLRLLFLCSLSLTLLPWNSSIDSPARPTPRIFASRLGYCGAKVIPDDESGGARLTVFRLDKSGAERPLWSSPVRCYPGSVIVAEDGRVLLLDCGEFAVVTMSARGEQGFQLRLEQLLTPDELKERTTRTVSSRLWRDTRTSFQFTDDHATIELSWGRIIGIDLKSGVISRK